MKGDDYGIEIDGNHYAAGTKQQAKKKLKDSKLSTSNFYF